MKKLFCLLCFSFAIQTVRAQHERYNVVNPDLWNKSKTQRTTGFVLLGVGAATALVGISVGVNHVFTDIIEGKEEVSGSGAMVAGLTLMAVSVPLFVAAGKNKRASLSVSNFPKSRMNGQNLLTLHSAPQLNLTLTSRLFKR